MRLFYETYAPLEKLAPMVREIAWSHNLIIMERCSDPLEREFYIRMTVKFGWSKNVLAYQIENQSYEKMLLGQTNFDRALSPEIRAQAKLAVRDEYTFDFLEMGEEHNVEYALRVAGAPIGVATYRTVKHLPKELEGQLPAPEEIIKLLEGAS